MAELRYNPVSREWVMVASHRQSRPQMPENWCPFCPGGGRVPDEGFTVLRYPNDFPALSQSPPPPDDVSGKLFKVRPAYGRCEVLLYCDRHTATVRDLSDEHVHAMADMWRECFDDMARDNKIEYVFIFENRGELVGVTMPHPHGQAYGYSYIPKKIQDELDGAREYYGEYKSCLFCGLLSEETRAGTRILFENDAFTAYVPFFSPVTYGMHVSAKRHVPHVGAMTKKELELLGEIIRDCAGTYDALFDKPFPYMMCMHNAPPGGGHDAYYHFHVEFVPPLRGADRQQFFASSETGAGAFCNPNRPEEKALELRLAYEKYKAWSVHLAAHESCDG